ncbi:hypothetical protein ACMFMG_004699 [Clarireedia jacksonii]
MSTTRLTFLYPPLFRSLRASESLAPTVRACSQPARRPPRPRNLSTTQRKGDTFVQRHGKAVEPFLKKGENEQNTKVFIPKKEAEIEEEEEEEEPINTKPAQTQTQTQTEVPKVDGEVKAKEPESKPSSAAPLSGETQAAAVIPGDLEYKGTNSQGPQEPTPRQKAQANTKDALAPLETVLHMSPPESPEVQNASKPPHLQTPPYVHHFDTYALVQQVQSGGFTKNQSITAMKAVRELLAINLNVAKQGLVSKSDVENETYLFRAACSELKTEIQNNRKANDEKMRRERTLLQHEVDILNQKLNQELLTLKDDLKGMFDDRKMTVRMEQRHMESAIQELNYKITVLLNSDSKSEIEGLRWVLTRRSVMGILFMAFMVLTSLRYASYKSHELEERRKKKEAAELKLKQVGEEIAHDLPPHGAAEILAAN